MTGAARAFLVMISVCAISACAPTPSICESDTELADAGLDDAGRDRRDTGVPAFDAPTRWDARVPYDASVTCVTALGAGVLFAVGPEETRAYYCPDDPPPDPVRLRIYRPGEASPVYDVTTDCWAGSINPAAEGRYYLTIESGRYAVGARLFHPERCTDAAFDDPYCEPVIVTLRRCEVRYVIVGLFCDPTDTTCPDVTWPWSD